MQEEQEEIEMTEVAMHPTQMMSTVLPVLITKINSTVADIISCETSPEATPKTLRSLYDRYFNLIGRLSHPQLPGKSLGEELYSSDPESRRKNHLMPSPDPKQVSRFTLAQATVYGCTPVLVSSNNQFAITALLSEPKEVFLSRRAYNAVDATMDPSITLVATGDSISIGKNKLLQYTVYWQPDTTECNKIATQIIKWDSKARDQWLIVHQLDTSKVPWGSHYAAKIAIDGADILTLENGSRWSWLYRGYLEYLQKNHRADYQKFNTQDNLKLLLKPLNESWYFRIYGPEEIGQDMKNQTNSRFTLSGLLSDEVK